MSVGTGPAFYGMNRPNFDYSITFFIAGLVSRFRGISFDVSRTFLRDSSPRRTGAKSSTDDGLLNGMARPFTVHGS